MIKVMVVIYGLVMFVPQAEKGGAATTLTALFVDSEHHINDTVHRPVIQWVQEETLGEPWDISGESDFAISITSPRDGGIHLGVRPSFPQLSTLTRSRVMDECLEPNGDCRSSSSDLTQGLARFSGAWAADDATYCCGFKLPIGDHDEATFKFPRSNGTDPDMLGNRQISTALVLTAELSEEEWEDFGVSLNGVSMKEGPISEQGCVAWLGSPQRCAILLVGNQPVEHGDCHEKGCRFDLHFSVFHLLTKIPDLAERRRLPYVTSNEQCPTPDEAIDHECLLRSHRWAEWDKVDPFNMPAVRCPPTFAMPE